MACIIAYCMCCDSEGSFMGILACMSQQPGALAGPPPTDCVVSYIAGQNGNLAVLATCVTYAIGCTHWSGERRDNRQYAQYGCRHMTMHCIQS